MDGMGQNRYPFGLHIGSFLLKAWPFQLFKRL